MRDRGIGTEYEENLGFGSMEDETTTWLRLIQFIFMLQRRRWEYFYLVDFVQLRARSSLCESGMFCGTFMSYDFENVIKK